MGPSFSTASLKSLEPTMNLYVQTFIEGIQRTAAENKGVVEMTKWFKAFSFDVCSPRFTRNNLGDRRSACVK